MSAFDPKRRLVRDPGLSAGIWPNSASSRPRAEMARLSWRDATANDSRGGMAQREVKFRETQFRHYLPRCGHFLVEP